MMSNNQGAGRKRSASQIADRPEMIIQVKRLRDGSRRHQRDREVIGTAPATSAELGSSLEYLDESRRFLARSSANIA